MDHREHRSETAPPPGRVVRLRGHHLLCLQGFRGYGYSETFTRELAAIVAALVADPETLVTVVAGPDAVCAHCPAPDNHHCRTRRTELRDQRVLSRLGWRVGDELPWSAVLRRLAERVRPSDLDHLCRSCPWLPLGFCAEGIALVRTVYGTGERYPVSASPDRDTQD